MRTEERQGSAWVSPRGGDKRPGLYGAETWTMDSVGHVFEPEDFSKSVILELSLRCVLKFCKSLISMAFVIKSQIHQSNFPDFLLKNPSSC